MPKMPGFVAKIYSEVTKDYKPLNTQPHKAFDNETKKYAHYPDFLKDDGPRIEIPRVQLDAPAVAAGAGKLSQEQFRVELEAQRKRAEARAYVSAHVMSYSTHER